jgi:integrase/recombinase XerD
VEEVSAQILVDAYTARLTRQGLAKGTVAKYAAAARDFLGWWGRDPSEARRADVERYLDEWAARSEAKPGSVRVRIAALKKLFDYLDSLGRLVDADGRELRSPVDRVERPRSRKRPNDWLSDEEGSELLGSTLNPQEAIVLALLRWAGLRVGEACALAWRDVDLERGELRVRRSKTDSGIRTVPVLPELDRDMRTWERRTRERGLWKPDGPVLVTRNGTAMKPQFAWRLVKRVADRAGVRAREAQDRSGWNISELTPHTLRRTFATDLLNRGVRLETVSKALGHSDTRVTQAYYAELLDQTARDEILRAMGAS